MKNIPNILSAFRIVLIPFFVWQIMAGNTTAAAVILAISGATDFFDGFLARKFNWITPLGKVLDPIADKLTQVAVCIVFLILLRQYWYFFAVLLLKEVVMLILGGYLLKKNVKIEGARWFGKVVTFLFYLVMVVLVFVPNVPHWLVVAMLSLVTVCALVAALLYLPEFIKYRQQIKPKNS
ncbi:CDP-alcohol phosphatidyltransferase family protein [Ruminococcaceae bacterium OttesenSCG-928-A16]|nr:CDP-alcohol phosphatidyltransferase family protein [Ruminococcaceae bacterium OttesenSCG-928-A16]